MTSGRLQEIKNKRKLQTVISKSGRGRLQEVVVYERIQQYLETLSLKGGLHLNAIFPPLDMA